MAADLNYGIEYQIRQGCPVVLEDHGSGSSALCRLRKLEEFAKANGDCGVSLKSSDNNVISLRSSLSLKAASA